MINVLEIIMVLATFMYSYLILYCKRSSFIFGIVASGITAYVLMRSGVYIQAILYLIYILIYAYSFVRWGKDRDIKVSNISVNDIVLACVFIITFTIGIGYCFNKIGTVFPYVDAFSTACSTVAIVLLSKKIIENSYVFVLSNIFSILICFTTKEYLTIFVFIIYMVFNIIRLFTWNNIKKRQNLNT